MPRYNIQGEDNTVEQHDLPGALRPVTLLGVPYVSQLEFGAQEHRNDCGAAAAVMLLQACKGVHVSVDEFYNKVNPEGEGMLSIVAIKNVLDGFRLFTEFRANLTLANLFNYLMINKPVLVMVKYSILRDAGLTESTDFTGPHFSVVVGMDTRFVYVHDPLYAGSGGEARPYPINTFRDAWIMVGRDTEHPAPEAAGLVPFIGVNTTSNQPPLYKVTSQAILRVRCGPGINFNQVGLLNPGDEAPVYNENKGWGEIEPGLWIKLEFTKRLKE